MAIFNMRHKKKMADLTVNDLLGGDLTMRNIQQVGRELYAGYLRNATLAKSRLSHIGNFHDYSFYDINGDKRTKRKMSAMLPKLVSEHIRKKMFGYGVSYTIESDKASPSDIDNLTSYLDDVIKDNDHWRNLADLVEDGLNIGSIVMKPTVLDGELQIDYLKGEKFWHSQYSNKMIYGGVFISEFKRNDYHYTKLTWYKKIDKETWEVEKELYRSKTYGKLSEQVSYDSMFDDERHYTLTNRQAVPFTYWKPNIKNNIVPESPLGIPITINALDKLKFVDTAFHRYFQELDNGGMLRVLPRMVFSEFVDDQGESHIQFNKENETVLALDSPFDNNEGMKSTDLTPPLRTEQFIQSFNMGLDFACASMGISAGTFRFDGNKIQTATESEIRAYETHETKINHEETLKWALNNLFISCLEMAKAEELDPRVKKIPDDIKINIEFEDQMFYNEQEDIAKYRQDAMDGVIPMWKYVLKAYPQQVANEEEAKQWVEEAKAEDDMMGMLGVEQAEEDDE